tara:strand:+ start:1185 stop:1385 length:201 start_codon:yes stop_codon:yes gene_type:complete
MTLCFVDFPIELIFRVCFLPTGLVTDKLVALGSLRIKLFWVSSGLNGLSLASSVGLAMMSFFLPFF